MSAEGKEVDLAGSALVYADGEPALLNQDGKLYALVFSLDQATPERVGGFLGMAAATGLSMNRRVVPQVSFKRVDSGPELVASLAEQGVGVMFNPSLREGGGLRWTEVVLAAAAAKEAARP